MKEFAKFQKLKALDLSETKVGDTGLKELAGLNLQLRTLYLADTDVTDEGLKEMAGMQALRTLDISQTWVTDAGLKALAGLRQLRTLRRGAACHRCRYERRRG
jgi:internalin A